VSNGDPTLGELGRRLDDIGRRVVDVERKVDPLPVLTERVKQLTDRVEALMRLLWVVAGGFVVTTISVLWAAGRFG
jgi:hypothetical protein